MKTGWLSRLLFLGGVVLVCVVALLHSRKIGAARSALGRSFLSNPEAYLTVDPALLLYDELAAIPVSLEAPLALAVGADDQIVVGGGQSIVVFSAEGSERSRISTEEAVQCLAVSDDQQLFVGVGNHLEVYDAAGERTAVWPPFAREARPSSIVLRGDDVLVGDARYGLILRYNRSGELLDRIEGLVLFSSPTLALAVDDNGRLWAASPGQREVRRYAADGTVAQAWRKPGRDINSFSGCCNPVDIAIRADGRLITAEKNILRVKVLDQTGTLVGVVAGPSSFDSDSDRLALAIDSAGRVLVLDTQRQAVRVFVEKVKR